MVLDQPELSTRMLEAAHADILPTVEVGAKGRRGRSPSLANEYTLAA
jgi:hypothetical protein